MTQLSLNCTNTYCKATLLCPTNIKMALVGFACAFDHIPDRDSYNTKMRNAPEVVTYRKKEVRLHIQYCRPVQQWEELREYDNKYYNNFMKASWNGTNSPAAWQWEVRTRTRSEGKERVSVCDSWPGSMAMVDGVKFPDDFLTEVEMNPSSGTGWTPVHRHDTHTHALMRTLPSAYHHTITRVTTNNANAAFHTHTDWG